MVRRVLPHSSVLVVAYSNRRERNRVCKESNNTHTCVNEYIPSCVC